MMIEQVDTPHVDHAVLQGLQEVMGDEYPLLLDTFLSDSQARVAQLHEAQNAEHLSMAAHSFKGSSSNMGAVQLARLCSQLEERAKRWPIFELQELIRLIDVEFANVQALYGAERSRFAA